MTVQFWQMSAVACRSLDYWSTSTPCFRFRSQGINSIRNQILKTVSLFRILHSSNCRTKTSCLQCTGGDKVVPLWNCRSDWRFFRHVPVQVKDYKMEILMASNEKIMQFEKAKVCPIFWNRSTYHMILVGSFIFHRKGLHSPNIDGIVKFYQISSFLLFQISVIFWFFPYRWTVHLPGWVLIPGGRKEQRKKKNQYDLKFLKSRWKYYYYE